MGTAILILVVLCFTGIYMYFWVPKFETYYRNRIVTTGVLSEFKDKGFLKEDASVVGNFNGYFVVLNLGWFDHFSEKVIRIHVVFTPNDETKEELTNRNRKLRLKYDKKYSWFLNEMTLLIPFRFIAPKFEQIVGEIDDMMKVLKDESLTPIEQVESNKVQSDYEYWQDYIE